MVDKDMPPLSSLKRDFTRKWFIGLRICSSYTKKNMSLLERKKAIKLSADLAMACARNGTTRWSRALIASTSKDDKNKLLVEHIISNDQFETIKTSNVSFGSNKRNIIRCKKIVKRSRNVIIKRVKTKTKHSSSINIAKRLVKKRTQVLKSLVPGGELMDDISLIEETLDYIMSLRAQVDVMRTLASI
ncbi:hypothetical protein ACFE04_008240 [Oxalis oulophora]